MFSQREVAGMLPTISGLAGRPMAELMPLARTAIQVLRDGEPLITRQKRTDQRQQPHPGGN
jgi:hypothetical protein